MYGINVKNHLYDDFIYYQIIKKGHFKLTTGVHSQFYVDKDKICTIPVLYNQVVQNIINNLTSYFDKFDIVTGPAVAGITYAAPVAHRLGKSFVYPEKKINGNTKIMDFRQVFRNKLKDSNVVIIEDIVTTGSSIMKTIKAINRYGGKVKGIVSIFDRSNNAMIKNNIIDSLFTFYKPLITKHIESYPKNSCPLCYLNQPLTNPKTGVIIE